MKLGTHIVADLLHCPKEVLNDELLIDRTLKEAAAVAELQIIWATTHRFKPEGVSSVVLIKESHISVHTWPEYGFAAVDIFVCGSKPTKALKFIEKAFKPKQTMIIRIERGIEVGRKTTSWKMAPR